MHPLETLISRDPNACFTQLCENEIIAIPGHDQGSMYHLNESAAADLWLMLDTPKTILELTQLLAQKYLGHAEEYEQDVMEWIDETHQKGLLDKQQMPLINSNMENRR